MTTLHPLTTKALALAALVFFLCIPRVTADEYEERGVKAAGVVFDINSDRKVEKIGGIVQPEPLDAYLKRLTDALSAQVSNLDAKVDRVEKKLDAVLASTKR